MSPVDLSLRLRRLTTLLALPAGLLVTLSVIGQLHPYLFPQGSPWRFSAFSTSISNRACPRSTRSSSCWDAPRSWLSSRRPGGARVIGMPGTGQGSPPGSR